MKRTLDILTALTLPFLLLCLSCSGGGGNASSAPKVVEKDFPNMEIPALYTSPEDRMDYALEHYWDDFSGVPMDRIEAGLSNYIGMLDNVPMDKAQKSIRRFFSRIVMAEEADTSAHYYTLMTQMVSKYLYDPNSPLRNEDYYLPFVSAMVESPHTSPDLKHAYEVEKKTCSINRFGEKAPDFAVRTIKGTTFRLYGIKAQYTMVFFSNPGCHACKSIIDDVCGRPYVDAFIEAGILAVVNVYIDKDLKAWREYEHNYPDNWHTGYDPAFIIREDTLYDVRAIPSLYLLDSEKRIIMKDAPTEKVMAFLDNLANNTQNYDNNQTQTLVQNS